MRMQQIALRRHISIAQRQTFTPEDQLNAKMATHEDHAFMNHPHGGNGSLPVHHYHQTYADDLQDNPARNQEEGILPRSSRVIVYRDTLNYNQSNVDHQGGTQARAQRSVTFDLSVERALFVSRKEGPYKISKTKMSTMLGPNSKPSQSKVSAKGNKRNADSRHLKTHKARSQGNNKLKMKLNLNPLRRSQVHPKSGSNHEDKNVKGTSRKKDKKDKSQKRIVKKDKEGQEKSKKDKTPEKSQHEESSTSQVKPGQRGETQSLEKNPEETGLQMQSSAENAEPLGTANTTTDPQVPLMDLDLAVSTTDDAKIPKKEVHMPQGGEHLPDDSTTPVSSTVSVVQEYLSSGDGSPKRKIRLIVPEKPSSRPQTALEKKIR